ncbi:acyltransferase family protein [Antiquaquibacter oligotrophicus]|uniref:acyltransferase family protein n=1 Tax=Antiquaquibacter oligotrophicus TaxID=2880260 RepID=UPI002AC9724D|nr:acyltransferase [Antiquaquibacter oligotrophicus]
MNIMRFGAALLVVAGHFRVFFFEDYSEAPQTVGHAILYSFTSVGAEAVVVFFVLSGFWVGGSAWTRVRGGGFAWKSYAIARVTRLWIVLLPALALTVILDALGKHLFASADAYSASATYAALDANPDHSLLTLVGNVFFLQDIWVQPYGTNNPLWSLSYEFWYYLLFPVFALAVVSRLHWALRLLYGILAVAIVIFVGPEVLLLMPAWILGAIVGANRGTIAAFLRRSPRPAVRVAQVVLAVGVLAAMVAHHQIPAPLRLDSLALGAITALLVASLVVDIRLPGKADLVLSGSSNAAHWSYSLYAVHMPIVVFLAAMLVPAKAERWTIDPPHVLLGLALISGICAFAWGFGRLTEHNTDRVRRTVSSWFQRRSGRSANNRGAMTAGNHPGHPSAESPAQGDAQ